MPTKLKQYEKILAVGVKDPRLNERQMMFLLLSEKEEDFRNYRINEQAFNRTVVEFTQTEGKHAVL